jgi:NAD(P)-dependent dehydrogenase (short-subunit alcohol dehydrogenase family)
MNIIITGASRGIGAEIVKILCKHKGNHIIALSRNGDALRKLVAECLKLNPNLIFTLSSFKKSNHTSVTAMSSLIMPEDLSTDHWRKWNFRILTMSLM